MNKETELENKSLEEELHSLKKENEALKQELKKSKNPKKDKDEENPWEVSEIHFIKKGHEEIIVTNKLATRTFAEMTNDKYLLVWRPIWRCAFFTFLLLSIFGSIYVIFYGLNSQGKIKPIILKRLLSQGWVPKNYKDTNILRRMKVDIDRYINKYESK